MPDENNPQTLIVKDSPHFDKKYSTLSDSQKLIHNMYLQGKVSHLSGSEQERYSKALTNTRKIINQKNWENKQAFLKYCYDY